MLHQSLRLQTILLSTALALPLVSIAPVWAVRQYDPAVDNQLLRQPNQPTPQIQQIQPVQPTQPAPAPEKPQPKTLDDTKRYLQGVFQQNRENIIYPVRPDYLGLPEAGPLGVVAVFADPRKLDGTQAMNIGKIQKIEGLAAIYYMPELMPDEYLKLLDIKEFGELDPERTSFYSDVNGRMAKKLRVTAPDAVVYYDPTGTRREYNLGLDFNKFMRHVERIRQK